MVLRSHLAVSVANLSAEVCQIIACNPERLPRNQVLYLIFCLPFQRLRHFALSLWSNLSRQPDPDPPLHSD